jgi:hypothetical protein
MKPEQQRASLYRKRLQVRYPPQATLYDLNSNNLFKIFYQQYGSVYIPEVVSGALYTVFKHFAA